MDVSRLLANPAAGSWGRPVLAGFVAGCVLFAGGLGVWLATRRRDLPAFLRIPGLVVVVVLWFLVFVATHPRYGDDSVRSAGEAGLIVMVDVVIMGFLVVMGRIWWDRWQGVRRSKDQLALRRQQRWAERQLGVQGRPRRSRRRKRKLRKRR